MSDDNDSGPYRRDAQGFRTRPGDTDRAPFWYEWLGYSLVRFWWIWLMVFAIAIFAIRWFASR